MDEARQGLHSHTPMLAVMDPRGAAVASIRYSRAAPEDTAQLLRERALFDLSGRVVLRWDARLSEAGLGNTFTIYSLSGQALAVDNVDAGWRVALPGEAGQVVEQWDVRSERRFEHDALLRPVAVFERGVGEEERRTECYAYGDDSLSTSNRCGRLVRQDDGAGSLFNEECSLSGAPRVQVREFGPCGDGFMPRSVQGSSRHEAAPTGVEMPASLQSADAPLVDLSREDGFIQNSAPSNEMPRGSGFMPRLAQDLSRHEAAPTGDEGTDRFVTCWRYGPTGEVLEQTDAVGHVRRLTYTLNGQLRSSQAMGQVLMQDAQYDARGRIEREALGNGVVTTLRYDPADGRLNQLQSARPDGSLLQNLSYHYDPVGNPLRIEDRAQSTRHFANQRIEPLRTFAYDTLYQLIEATGYEAVNDEGLANYRETYAYDAAGNMLKLTHVGAQHFTREWRIDEQSNRSLPTNVTENFTTAFDANGNLQHLQPGQALYWDLRNQLSEVHPVQREDGTDDYEHYTYDASGQRLRKTRLSQAKAVTHIEDVLYLPGLQLRRNMATGETLHVIELPASHSHVRLLHWQTGKPEALPNDQPRYELTDYLGSTTLELDSEGKLISQELYYPYGGTAWSAARNAVEVNYRFVRYSGKERDATGLYYYGLRYYAPWLCRWINPDPAGEVDGLNLYRFVQSNPIGYVDPFGADSKVPKIIHYIWVGIGEGITGYLENIRKAAELNEKYSIVVHLDLKETQEATTVQAAFKELVGDAAKNVSFSPLRQEAFFKKFEKTWSYLIYEEFLGADSSMYAMAADVLRYELVRHYGGIYSDVDDKFTRPLERIKFVNKRGRVFTGEEVTPPWDHHERVVNNNLFAAHKGNSTLGTVSEELISRYEKYGAGGFIEKLKSANDDAEKMKLVSAVTGPKLFTSVLSSSSKGYDKLLKLIRQGRHALSHNEMSKRMPLQHYVVQGAANSWQKTSSH